MPLATEPRLADPDGFYERLVEAHRGLDAAASRRLDAALVIILSNHVGDMAILEQAIELACATVASPERKPD